MKKLFALAFGLLMTIVSANASTDITGRTGDYTVSNGENLQGTATGLRIIVPDGYTVYFFNCDITGGTTGGKAEGAAVYCKGNATIKVYNERHAQFKSGNANCAAIYVPDGKTLKIEGLYNTSTLGKLTASCYNYNGDSWGAGIGADRSYACGNIEITHCDVTATGGRYAAGIGGAYNVKCGNITIAGDAIVTATRGISATCAIGKGYGTSTSGTVTIAGVVRKQITYKTYKYEPWDGDLWNLTTDTVVVALDGTVISGYCNNTQAIYIADNATVTLDDAEIHSIFNSTFSNTYKMFALTCLGNATIKLKGKNDLYGPQENNGGIFVPQGKTLTIEAGTTNINANSGALYVTAGSEGAGIGAGDYDPAGNIVINSGYIEATGGYHSAAIGAAGSTYGSCQNITISKNVTYLKATKGNGALNSIGATSEATCGTVTIAGQVTGSISKNPYYYPALEWDGNLSTVTEDVVAKNGLNITGTLNKKYKVTIADGATVTLSNATINSSGTTTTETNCYAALTCEGNATIVLYGSSSLQSFYSGCPAIYVPNGKTLTIKSSTSGSTGKLKALGTVNAAAIGAGTMIGEAGNIVIESGDITAEALGDNSAGAAGIGGAHMTKCGDITILGGTVTAKGISKAPAIGAGQSSTCGKITIAGWDVKKITATRGADATYSIGKSTSTCGGVYIQKTETEYALVSNEGIKNYKDEATFVYEPEAIGKSTNNLGEIYGLATAYITSYKSYYPDIIAPLEQKAKEVKTKWDTYWYDYVCLDIIANELDQANQTAWAAICEQQDAKKVAAEALQDAISTSEDYLKNVIYNLGDEYAQIGFELYTAIEDAKRVLGDEEASLQELQDAITDMQNALAKAKAEVEAMGIGSVYNTATRNQKVIRNGQLLIIRDGKIYNATGAEVK